MGGNGLRHTRGISRVVRIRLEKVESAILDRMVTEGCRLEGSPRRPTLGQAVVALLRVAFNCIRCHTDKYADPEPISDETALQLGLRLPPRRKRRRSKAAKRAL